jgi:hypothetical protein
VNDDLPTHCSHCGEQLGTEAIGEVYRPYLLTEDSDGFWLREVTTGELCGPYATADAARADRRDDASHLIVHAEPCATELLAKGWELA